MEVESNFESYDSDSTPFLHENPLFWSETQRVVSKYHIVGAEMIHATQALGPTFKDKGGDFENYLGVVYGNSDNQSKPLRDSQKILTQLSALRTQFDDGLMAWYNSSLKNGEQFIQCHKELGKLHTTRKEHLENTKRHLSKKINVKDKEKDRMEDVRLGNKECDIEEGRLNIELLLRSLKTKETLLKTAPFLTLMETYLHFFKSGYELLKDYEPLVKKVKEKDIKTNKKSAEVQMELEHALESKREEISIHRVDLENIFNRGKLTIPSNMVRDLARKETVDGETQKIHKSGYLYLPSPNFGRVFCDLKDGILTLEQEGVHKDKVPLMLCTVKPNPKQKLVFGLISPQRTINLQATNNILMQEWINVINNAIGHSLLTAQDDDPKKSEEKSKEDIELQDKRQQITAVLQGLHGNDKCADCGASEPSWLSMNLGVLVCLKCSGVHRSLGVHVSKVRSCGLDSLDDNIVKYMTYVGNTNSNRIWSPLLQDGYQKRDGFQRETFIQNKYVNRKWVNERPCQLKQTTRDRLLYRAVEQRAPLAILEAISFGANVNAQHEDEEGRGALHFAVHLGDTLSVDCLVLNSADVDVQDHRGWTPLHYAAYNNNEELIRLLLQRASKKQLETKDFGGNSPLQTLLKYNEPLIDGEINEQREVCRSLLVPSSPQKRGHSTTPSYSMSWT